MFFGLSIQIQLKSIQEDVDVDVVKIRGSSGHFEYENPNQILYQDHQKHKKHKNTKKIKTL